MVMRDIRRTREGWVYAHENIAFTSHYRKVPMRLRGYLPVRYPNFEFGWTVRNRQGYYLFVAFASFKDALREAVRLQLGLVHPAAYEFGWEAPASQANENGKW